MSIKDNVLPTYLGSGDPARRFADYYPAWLDKLGFDCIPLGPLSPLRIINEMVK